MLVRLPVPYEAQVTPKGARVMRKELFVSWEDFHIEEVEAADAPVAVRGLRPFLSGPRDASYTRWHAGSHWIEDRAGTGGNEPVTLDRWSESLAGRNPMSSAWRAFLDRHLQKGATLENAGTIGQREIREIGKNWLEDARAAVRELCRGLVCVDGAIMRRVDHPVIHGSGPYGNGYIGVEFGIGWIGTAYDWSLDVFSLDRWEDMEMYFRDMNPAAALPARPEVLVTESCAWPDEEASVLLSARACIRSFVEWLPKLDERQGVAWFRLRATAERLGSSLSEEEAQACSEAMSEFADALAAAPVQKLERMIQEACETATRSADRWKLRPVLCAPDSARP
mgnify:CR=1 FL=1